VGHNLLLHVRRERLLFDGAILTGCSGANNCSNSFDLIAKAAIMK
jgi:hypothetical protein